jgi:urease accessory protein
METDTKKIRDDRPYIFTDLLRREKIDEIVAWMERTGGLAAGEHAAITISQF